MSSSSASTNCSDGTAAGGTTEVRFFGLVERDRVAGDVDDEEDYCNSYYEKEGEDRVDDDDADKADDVNDNSDDEEDDSDEDDDDDLLEDPTQYDLKLRDSVRLAHPLKSDCKERVGYGGEEVYVC